jgi:hypothetical protein
MNLETFCDLVWSEIWDDCAPMGDQAQYREIVKQLFLDGKDPYEIWFETTDAKGKKKRQRLAQAPSRSSSGRRHDLQALRELMEQAQAAAQAQLEQEN